MQLAASSGIQKHLAEGAKLSGTVGGACVGPRLRARSQRQLINEMVEIDKRVPALDFLGGALRSKLASIYLVARGENAHVLIVQRIVLFHYFDPCILLNCFC